MPKKSASPSPRKESSSSDATLQLSLKTFVHEAWTILEPVSRLQWNWHLDLICEYLTLIKDKNFKSICGPELEGIIFNVPPRTMKSLLITVFFPVWLWTYDPSRRFMFVSYSEKLSTQHSVFRRGVMESDWYQKNWGGLFTFSKDQNLKSHYENSRRGTMFSTGMQATATGLGGDILVFDDPLNPEQAISQVEREAVNVRFDTTFRSRINDPVTGVKIIIMQRLHELDLTGHVLGREAARWKHLSLPAIAGREESLTSPGGEVFHTRRPGDLLWSARLPQSFLESQRVGMGSWAFHGQYQQSPAPLEGGIIKRQWVRFYRQLPEKLDFMVQSWDCTFSGGSDNDFVAGQVWGRSGGKYFMLPYRAYDRMDFGPTMAAIKACHASFPRAHAILIEDKANGPAIISELQKEIPGIMAINPEGGKIARAQATAPLWESGSIELPDPQVFHVPWIEDYIHNICTFPKAAHDDDMDSTSQALIYMRNRLGGGILDFYRRQAAGECAQPQASQPPSRLFATTDSPGSGAPVPGCVPGCVPGSTGSLDAGSSGTTSHEAGSPGLRLPSAWSRVQRFGRGAVTPAESALARNLMAAIGQGSQIQCNAKQYPAVRAALNAMADNPAFNAAADSPAGDAVADNPAGDEQSAPALLAQNEINRLDQMFNWPAIS
jgi:predicted phage terminase large subunit-like protein